MFNIENELTVKGLNPVAADRIVIRFSAIAESVEILLKDYYDDRNEISFVIKESGGACYVEWGGIEYPVAGSLSDMSKGFYLVLDSGGSLTDGAGNSVCIITHNNRGDSFGGFEKKGAAISFNVISGSEGKFALLQLGNQIFSANDSAETYTDLSGPEIVLDGETGELQREINERITVPVAYAYDVLCGITDVTVKVTDPDGNVLSEFDGVKINEEKSFTAEKYGYYVITYLSIDLNSKITENKIYIYVKDSVMPEININGEVRTEIKVGQTITFPSASATDNYLTPQLYLLVNLPDGSFEMLSEDRSYTFKNAGNYRLVYYAYDSDYNLTMKEFVIRVS